MPTKRYPSRKAEKQAEESEVIEILKELDSLQYLPLGATEWLTRDKVTVLYQLNGILKVLIKAVEAVYYFDRLEGDWALFSKRTEYNGLAYVRIPLDEYNYLRVSYQTAKAIKTNNGRKKKSRPVV